MSITYFQFYKNYQKPLSRAAAAEGAEFPVVDVEADGAGEGDEEVAQVDEAQNPSREIHQLTLGLKNPKV